MHGYHLDSIDFKLVKNNLKLFPLKLFSFNIILRNRRI